VEIVQQLIPIVIAVSLIGMEASLGLRSGHGKLLYVLRRPGLLLRALVAVNVIVPVAALAMVSLFPLSPAARGGILVMAASTVPPIAPDRALDVGGDESYTFGLYVALVLLSVILVPATVALISHVYGLSVPLNPMEVGRDVLQKTGLPVIGGLVIRAVAPRFAARAGEVIGRFAGLLLLVAVVPILIKVAPVILGLMGDGTIVAMALVAAIAIVGGQLLGGEGPTQGAALATLAAMRHPGIALLIVGAAGLEGPAQKRVTGAVIAFLVVSTLVAIPYRIWLKRRAKASPQQDAIAA
jgi:BASS family bile acid:Na+ symporter